ncbi:sigma-54-dependent Fis family transcriptional regulator [Geobacter sp. FeAm09]|uniref:sigma-54-dependent Fis family transcriptional regulator n=1 Tax=Geobacter sp. FeAm09 TaxID=2597769 RepID=UPI0011F08BCE|nr:sigma-54-dependent Fis family transcriptional regulator [Geobacter sp. FeAm09]QEM69063.1 sigma-54-dependent Fis family transcriptional regulator [Geobacter sp. FeAm09]
MQARDFSVKDLLTFIPEEGIVRLMEHRVLIFDAVALGLLRKEIVDTFGVFAARSILTRFGYAHGWRTAEILRSEYPAIFADWRAGSHLHMMSGLTKTVEFNQSDGNGDEPLIEVCWHNSYEAEQQLLSCGLADEPICWTLTGFASGYESCKNLREVYFVEDRCCGKGDSHCHIVGRFKEKWGPELEHHIPFYSMESADALLRDLTDKLKITEKRLKSKQRQLNFYASETEEISGFISRSNEMKGVIELAQRIAKVDSSVIVTGESGVGKERISRFIHDQSVRTAHPFVAINCGALTETLLESELFGHAKGAFTGADRDRAGLFEDASGGTLFLDEIGEISPAMQVKLLRALQEKEIRRVGDNTVRPVNVRIIAATNRNLKDDVAAGRFRRDLYYRLCVIQITVPPLRERSQDILPLARLFLGKTASTMGRDIDGFSPHASELLLRYTWPGNVRELQNVIERSLVVCNGRRIEPEDFPEEIHVSPRTQVLTNQDLSLEEMEREYILAMLRSCDDNKKLAAARLKIGKTTLYRKLAEYGKL